MGILTRVADRIAEVISTRIGSADRTFWLSDLYLEAAKGVLSDPYSKNAWVHRAVEIIAQNCASVPLRFYSGDPDDPKLIDSTPFSAFFANPNPELTPGAFWELTVANFLLPPGDGFWILESRMDFVRQGEVPTRAWPVSGKAMREKVNPQTGIVEKWIWSSGSRQYELEPFQVVQFQLPDPARPTRGMSPIESAGLILEADYQSDAWNKAMLDNGAQPAGLITFPNLGVEQVKANLKLWEGRHKGAARAGKIGALAGDAKYQQLGMTHDEMGFVAQKEWARQTVAAVYGVPLFLLTVMGDVHRETSREALKLFWENTVAPHLGRMAQAINTRLIKANGVWCKFDLSGVAALQREATEKREVALRDWQMGFSRNAVNARHQLGYEDDPLGETSLIPVGMQPAELAISPEMPEDSALAPVSAEMGTQDVQVTEDLVLNGAQIQAALSIVLAVTAGELPRDSGIGQLIVLFNLTPEQAEQIMGSAGKPEVETTPNPVGGEEPKEEVPPELDEEIPDEEIAPTDEEPEDEEARGDLRMVFRAPQANYRRWRAWIRAVQEPGERRYRAAYIKWLRGPRKDTLAFVEANVRVVTDSNIDVWLSERREEWARDLERDTRPIIELIVGESATLAASEINLKFEPLETPSILDIIEKHGLERSKLITGTLAKDVKRVILGSVSEGGTVTEIQTAVMDAVKGKFNQASAGHSLTVARTESASAANESRAETYKAGGVDQIEWVTAGDSEVRDSHQIDGEVTTMGQAFSNGLLYPHDPGALAEDVINCRCTFIAAGEI